MHHRPWLPRAAIDQGVGAVPCRQVVADWSAKWFARAAATVRGEAAIATALDLQGGTGWDLADGVAIIHAASVEQAVLSLLFGPRDDGGPLTASDEAVLQAVVDACLGDLRSRLATAFRLPADAAWRPDLPSADGARRWIWRVEAGQGVSLLRIVVDEALVARRVRAALPPVARGRAPASLAAGLAAQAIAVSARVGGCRLTTAELGGLGLGDVVVLDRALDDPIDLAVDRDPKPRPCTVEDRDGRLTLILA